MSKTIETKFSESQSCGEQVLYKFFSCLLSKQVRLSQAGSGVTETSLGSGNRGQNAVPLERKGGCRLTIGGKVKRNQLLFLCNCAHRLGRPRPQSRTWLLAPWLKSEIPWVKRTPVQDLDGNKYCLFSFSRPEERMNPWKKWSWTCLKLSGFDSASCKRQGDAQILWVVFYVPERGAV